MSSIEKVSSPASIDRRCIMVNTESNESIYSGGEYLLRNPAWHTEDSPWKAKHILSMIKKNGLSPLTICEVGCGAGEILCQLQRSMSSRCEFDGYDISPQAYSLSLEKANKSLRFHLGDFLATADHFDMILLVDLIEHLENYYGFLKEVRPRSDFKIFHIPLDLGVRTILRPINLEMGYRKSGHLHNFTKESAFRSLEYCGYRILDSFYTHGFIELPQETRLARLMQTLVKTATNVNDDWSARLFAYNSLMVLVR